MGFIFGDKNKGVKNSAQVYKNNLNSQIKGIGKGTYNTAALNTFDRGLADAQNSQKAIAASGFGGNVGNRIRNLDNATADLNINANTARDILETEEQDRLKKLKLGYGQIQKGAQASVDQNNAALISAGAQTGASIFDMYNQPKQKPVE